MSIRRPAADWRRAAIPVLAAVLVPLLYLMAAALRVFLISLLHLVRIFITVVVTPVLGGFIILAVCRRGGFSDADTDR